MKRILKWTAIALGGLIVLTLLASLALYASGMEKLTRSYPNISVEKISISTDPDAVTRGKHIATIWGCTKCHGENLSGALITNDPIEGIIPILGTIPASNLTSGKGGIAQSYADTDWERAIRHGVKPNGRVEVFMFDYSTMSDRDLGDLIGYLKQIPPVDSDLSAMNYGPILPIAPAIGLFSPVAEQINHNASRPADPVPGTTKEYGKYLSAICAGCHGESIAGKLKNWKQKDFIRTFQTGVLPSGKHLGPTMSSKTFSEMTDMELTALWIYAQNMSPTQAQK